MGLTDLTSRLLIEFKGDTSDLKGKLRELTAEEKKLAQAQIEHAEKRNKGLDQWGDKLAKSALILDGVEKVSNLLGDSIGKTAKSMLTAAANGATLGATFAGPVGAAIGGAIGALGSLISHTDQQSAASLRAAEAAKKHAAALELVRQGETNARGERRDARQAVELAEEELNRESMLATKLGLGQDSAAVEKARRNLREAQAEREALNRKDGVIWLELRKRELERINSLKDIEAAERSGIITEEEGRRRKDALLGVTKETTKVTDEAAKATEKHTARTNELAAATAKLAAERAKLASRVAKELTDDLVKQLESESPSSILNGGAFSSIINPDKLSASLDFVGALRKQQSAYGSDGFVDEIAKYSGALQQFTDIATAAYDAVGNGAGAVLQAIRLMAQQQLLGLGKVEVVEAIRQLGLGFGSLANPLTAGEAALHFKSAAIHGAAAAAAGLGVAALGAIGGGGGGAPGGATAGGAGAYLGGGTRTQTVTTIYIVGGDSHSEDSPRIRQRNAEKTVELGLAKSQTVVGGF